MDPAPRDRGALLTALTTEHFTLQGARSATITESLGRSTIYLAAPVIMRAVEPIPNEMASVVLRVCE